MFGKKRWSKVANMLQVEEKLSWKFVSWSEAQKSDQEFSHSREVN